MRCEFHPEALEEYHLAISWYAERDPHVAGHFIEAVEDAIFRIVKAPRRWRIVEEDVRRCLTHVFPYSILYTIESDFLLIVAVMHFSREPEYWKRRSQQRT
jgi:toxin ParE1/3/4